MGEGKNELENKGLPGSFKSEQRCSEPVFSSVNRGAAFQPHFMYEHAQSPHASKWI